MSTEPLPASLASYKPSSNEKEAYNYLFKKADTESLGVLTGDLAVPFFSHSSLPPILLGEIWQISDPENNGFLTPERFGVACRLIGHAQEEKKTKGVPEVKQEWVAKAGPFPTFKDYPIPSHLTPAASKPAPPSSPRAPATSQRAAPPAPASRLSAQTTGSDINQIKQDDKTNYARLFAGANGGSLTGLIDGEKARDIFIKSELPYETLGQIWNLADTHSRGSLDLADFTIGMHLLQLVLNGQLSRDALPKVLDPKMYASAAGLNGPGQSSSATPQSPLRQSSIPPPRNISSPPPPQQPQFQPQPGAAGNGGQWKITAQEKAESDNWFGQLDSNNKGVLEGEQAVGFFGQSGLGVEDLAKIWDLSDITNSGTLSRDTFAVAMKLIREKVSNPTGFQLPDQLPLEYVPPALRSDPAHSRAGSHPTPQQQMSQPQQDLFDLMGDDNEAPATPTPASPPPFASSFAPLQPQSTGPIQRSLSPQATGSSFQGLKGTIFPQNTGSRSGSGMISPQATGTPRSSGFQNNFEPSQSATSSSFSSAPPAQQQQAQTTSSNFFDDNDLADTTSNLSSLRDRSAKLEQEDSETTKALKTTSKTREELETEVEKVNEQIRTLQEKVSNSRQQLETERNAVEDLKKREQEQKGVLSRARTELISSESDLSGLKMEKSEMEGEFLRDKEEVREVKKRLTMVEEEKRILRGEIEKLKKEGRREKGLGAIARKQLASAETDRGKLEEEFETLKAAPIEAAHEEEFAQPAVTRQMQPAPAALAAPLPRSTVTSPTASLRSNNPFDRLNLASAGLSPQPTGQSTASNSNPFPFASSSPTTSSFAVSTPAQSREVASSTKSEEQAPKVQDSILPIASAAVGAVGAGALYAIETAGSSITNALGMGSPNAETKEIEPEQKEQVDPFGVPSHPREESQSTDAFGTPSTSTAGFGDDFGATSFGDDFSQPREEQKDTVQGTLGEVDNDAGFDEAFEELQPAHAESSQGKEPEVVEGKLGDLDNGEGFDDAFQDFQPEQRVEHEEKVAGTLGEIDQGAGFDEAFDELEEGHKVDKGKGKEVVRDDTSEEDVFAEPAEDSKPSLEADKGEEQFIEHAHKGADEDSSDDEEDGPEDLDRPSAFTRRSLDAEDPSASPIAPSASMFDSPAQIAKEGTSNSESGESYVHVTGSTAESSGILDSEQAPSVEPLPIPAPVPAPVPTPVQRRAAPPPPTRSAIVVPSSVPTPSQPQDTSYPVSDDFDAGFDGTRLRAPVETSAAPTEIDSSLPTPEIISSPSTSAQDPTAPKDDFESAFDDMSIQPSSSVPHGESPREASNPGFDTFDDDFEFKPAFGNDSQVSNATEAPKAKDEFDDGAFAGFDDSFAAAPASSSAIPSSLLASTPAPLSSESPERTSVPAPQKGFSFHGSFGNFPFANASSATTSAPPALAPPVAAPPPMARMPSVGQGDARDDDSSDIKEICGMGFPRAQAIEALAKYDHDLNRAINSLLG